MSLVQITKVVPRVYLFLWQAAPFLATAAILLLTATALIPAGIILATKFIIDGVVLATGSDGAWSVVVWPAVLLCALWVTQAIVQSVNNPVQLIFGERTYTYARRRLIEKAASLDLAFYDAPKFHDKLRHANDQLWEISSTAMNCLDLLRSIISLVAMASLLAVLDPLAIVILLAAGMPRVFMHGRLAKREFAFESEHVRNMRMIDYIARLLTSRDSAKEVRTLALKDLLVARFVGTRETQMRAHAKMLSRFFRMESSLNVLSVAGIAGIWGYAIVEAIREHLTIGELAMVFQAAQQGQHQITTLIQAGGAVYRNALFVTHFFDLLDLDPLSVDAALHPSRAEPLPMHELRKGLELRSVSFKYPGSDAWALRNVSLELAAGSSVAVVGENGSGKTTLVKLLARLYDPTEGVILVDGADLRDYELADVRREVAVVFQDFFRYDFTARDNVGFGQVAKAGNARLVEEAARKAGAHDFLARLPNGYDTVLGKTLGDGVDLSGGEWQQVAIGRAFMSDAAVLILDEPTAALDAFREQRLYEEFANLSVDRTTVFVAHRLSTVRMADVIVVLEAGCVIECGSHDDLVAENGKYAAMFNAQAARYR